MTDEPRLPLEQPPAPVEPAPPREPFWDYSDLFLVVGLGVPGMALVATGVSFLISRITRIKVASLLPGQFLGYAVLFAVIWFIFRTHYERPFWDSLAWKPFRVPLSRTLLLGVVTAVLVVLTANAIGTKETPNPMKELLTGRGAIAIVAVTGTTVGPVCEELVFRGFLQPLLVRSAGAVLGILLSSIPFGLLHLPQYGWSWRHAVLVTLAGCAFGWMRHVSGSTRASSLMHAAYNGVFFFTLLSQWRDTPNLW
jgi:uncharacterized protein